ncbi:MAG: protein-disulfide reductase DsbD [Gammaproteobacteria bacterium]|nr:protein-disulfide reductase DsbD [Gammaproteobacteria bacterium]
MKQTLAGNGIAAAAWRPGQRFRAALLLACFWPAAVFAQLPLWQPDDDEEFLPPDQAFVLTMARGDGDHFIAQWRIADGYYMYRDKTALAVDGAPVALDKPRGEMINDPNFGDTEIYRHQAAVHFRTQAETGELTYQGCADAGLCYPPITRQVRFDAIAAAAAAPPGAPPTAAAPNAATPPATAGAGGAATPRQSEQDQLADYLADARLGIAVLVFFGLGLLLAFTPCVLPMVPILFSVITTPGGGTVSTRKAFALSSVYVLAMALTYSGAGVAVALSGHNFQLWFQRPAVIVSFAAVFVLLALAMFGVWKLQLPSALQTRLSGVGEKRRGRLAGAAVMGVLAALVASPCVTPPLIGALLFVARTGDAATGGLALFSLALGMGAPLLAIGTSLGKLVPKPGPFLNVVQMLFGFILLGFAIWLLDRVVLGHVTMLLAGALIGALCIVLFRIVRGAGVWPLAARALNSLVLAYAVLLAANASVGGENWLRPWHFEARQAAHASALPFERHRSLGDIQHGIRAAADRQQWTMLVFYADWCVSCKELEAFTFSDAEVQRLLTDAALLEADVTESDDNSRELLGRFSLYGPPAILFFDSAAREVEWARIVGFVGADDFAEHLGKVFGYGSASTR